MDPDSELICATTVTPGNVGDAAPAESLLAADLPSPDQPTDDERPIAAGDQPALSV